MASNIHTTHCCILHGCKYCEDDCPVVNGIQEQEYSCDDCQPYMNFSLTPFYMEVDVYSHYALKMGYQKCLAVGSDKDIKIGQMVQINLSSRENFEQHIKRAYQDFCVDRYSLMDDLQYYEDGNKFVLLGHISHISNVGDLKIVSLIIEKAYF